MPVTNRQKTLVGCVLAAFALLPCAAHASTLTVSNCNDAGSGSLRAAVAQANAINASVTIDLTHLSCSRISLTTGALTISNPSPVLQGPGVNKLTLSGTYNDRVIVHTGVNPLFVYDLHIVAGSSSGSGGCMYTTTGFSLHRVKVSACTAVGTAAINGGAIYSKGNMLVQNSSVYDTFAYSTGGAVSGGVVSAATLLLGNSTIADGYAKSSHGAFGGGISATGLFASYSLISGNRADAGGGIAIQTGGAAVISSSTISGNTAQQCGGGIYSKYNLTLENSTIAFNKALRTDKSRSCAGGGVYSALSGKDVDLVSTIISNNVSYDAGGSFYASDFGAQAFMSSNTISGDHDLIVAVDAGSRAPPSGTLRSDPRLQPLRGNGGGSPTHALGAGSPAIDHGSNPLNANFDQRGSAPYPRTRGGGTDIGAFETNPDVIFINGFD